jgi:hypothetical protein
LIFLWFGSWKNGVSTYPPLWVKTDLKRFPRAQNKEGESLDILSAFSEVNLKADDPTRETLQVSLMKQFNMKYRHTCFYFFQTGFILLFFIGTTYAQNKTKGNVRPVDFVNQLIVIS